MIALTGAFPVDIRMVRVSANETSTRRASSTFFQAYTEIIDEKFRYPNSCFVGLRFDSRQFGSVPSRKYLIRGIKVKIPSNATVDTTKYLDGSRIPGFGTELFQQQPGRTIQHGAYTTCSSMIDMELVFQRIRLIAMTFLRLANIATRL